MLDIFNDATPQNGTFFKFKEIGDSVQGTYINKREGIDGYGNPQIIYIIKDSTGAIWNVAYRKTNEIIQKQMNEVHFGQIVGFRFDAKKESKKSPGTIMHIINQYSDPKFVDKEWLEEEKKKGTENFSPSASMSNEIEESRVTAEKQWNALGNKETKSVSAAQSVFTREKAPEDSQPLKASIPVSKEDDTMVAIRTLATSKGLVPPGVDIEVADTLIEGFTGMMLNKDNYTKIIVALSGYNKK